MCFETCLKILFLDDDQVDWMKLFLNRTNELNTNIDNNLCDVEVVLKEVRLFLSHLQIL